MVHRFCYTPRSVKRAIQGLKVLKPSTLRAWVRWLKTIEPLPVREQKRQAGLLVKALRERMRAERPENWGHILQLSSKKKATTAHATPDQTPY